MHFQIVALSRYSHSSTSFFNQFDLRLISVNSLSVYCFRVLCTSFLAAGIFVKCLLLTNYARLVVDNVLLNVAAKIL